MSVANHNTLRFGAPPGGEANGGNAANLDPALRGLPLMVVGQGDPLNPDRSLGFPHVMYHGTKADTFTFNDRFNHTNSPIGTGARTGRGLYTASQRISSGFGRGTVAELVPHNAVLLDLEAPGAQHPLTPDFKQAFLEDYKDNAFHRAVDSMPNVNPDDIQAIWRRFAHSGKLVTKDEVRHVAEKMQSSGRSVLFGSGHAVAEDIAARVNTSLLLEGAVPQLSNLSLSELFGAVDKINGQTRIPENVAMDFVPILDFLTARGVDGALTVQTFGPKGGHQERGAVFWKLDKLGDAETWRRRQLQTSRGIGSIATNGANRANVSGRPEATQSLDALNAPYNLSAAVTQHIFEKVKNGQPLMPKSRMDAIARRGSDPSLDPLVLVRNLATGSPEMSALLSANTGVRQGYRLHEHTQAVLGQFEKMYAHRVSDKERQLLRLALMSQDIGKSLAVAHTGDKSKQTLYNVRVAENILAQVDDSILTKADKMFLGVVIGQDVLGQRLQGKTSEATAQQAYKALLARTPPTHMGSLKRFMQIMYMCDASAYTDDARFVSADGRVQRAQANLNGLFERNDQGMLSLREPHRSLSSAVFN